jgi:hypothetical protein
MLKPSLRYKLTTLVTGLLLAAAAALVARRRIGTTGSGTTGGRATSHTERLYGGPHGNCLLAMLSPMLTLTMFICRLQRISLQLLINSDECGFRG